MDYGSVNPDTSPRRQQNRRLLWASLVILVVLVVIAAVAVVSVFLGRKGSKTTSPGPTTTTGSPQTLPCPVPGRDFPDRLATKEECENVTVCQWNAQFNRCVLPPIENYGYIRQGAIKSTKFGIQVNLTRIQGPSLFGKDIENIVFETFNYDENHLRIKVYDPNDPRYEPPVHLNLPLEPFAGTPLYELKITDEGQPFSFQVVRRKTKTKIWSSDIGGFTFSDQFLQIATELPSDYLYGLGENSHGTFKREFNKTFAIFPNKEKKLLEEGNLDGAHPVYQCVEDAAGNTHGVFLLNSNPMEYSLLRRGESHSGKSDKPPFITFRTIGGILDFNILLETTPEKVTQRYTELVGRPAMPPYWALGFQFGSPDFDNVQELEDAVNRIVETGIPLDVIHGGLNIRSSEHDFTVDRKWSDLPSFIAKSRAIGRRFIVTMDPTLPAEFQSYRPAKRGKDKKVFVDRMVADDSSTKKELLIPAADDEDSKVVLPDYFKNSAQRWWEEEISRFRRTLPFDGLWLENNDPVVSRKLHCPQNNLESPPYATKAIHGNMVRLSDATLCLSALHELSERSTSTHYNVHSLYGWSQAAPSLRGVENATSERGLVVSRSTFPSSGRWSGHWIPTSASAPELHRSIVATLEFGMFGVPYTAPDICGSDGETTEGFCRRSFKLGAFSPFSRFFGSKKSFTKWPSVASAARESLHIRYRLLPHLYTLFHEAHTKGSTVFRPLLNEFPDDVTARMIDTQFLWGSSLLFSPPFLSAGPSSTAGSAYFPRAVWYPFIPSSETVIFGPKKKKLTETNGVIPIHIRGGSIIVTQTPGNNTKSSRRNPFEIIVALDSEGRASGSQYWDDGVTKDAYEKKRYFLANFNAWKEGEWTQLNVTVLYNALLNVDLPVESVHVYGVGTSPTGVGAGGKETDAFTYNSKALLLKINVTGEDLMKPFTVKWKTA